MRKRGFALAAALSLASSAMAQESPALPAGQTMWPDAAPDAVIAGDVPPAGVQPAGAGASASPPSDDQGGDLYCRRKLGTWFYCEKPKRPAASPQAAVASQSSTERLKAIQEQLDELKARAVLEPSTENVMAYISFQRQQLDRASTFSDVWQRAIWQNPSLDYTLQRPVTTVAKRAWIDNRTADRSAVLRRIGERYGVFYFYAQSCAACEIQAPILKSVADMNGIHVQAVSMDGGPNRVFPNYLVDSGQGEKMGLTSRATPALILFDTVTKRPIPIGTGLMAADEIAERIFQLTNVKPGSDY